MLKGRPIQRRLGMTASNHYQVQGVDETTEYRVAINGGGEDASYAHPRFQAEQEGWTVVF